MEKSLQRSSSNMYFPGLFDTQDKILFLILEVFLLLLAEIHRLG